jgi:hypothetical protein
MGWLLRTSPNQAPTDLSFVDLVFHDPANPNHEQSVHDKLAHDQ